MQVEARQVNVGRVHVWRGVMPVPVLTSGPAVAYVMLVSPPAMPVMPACAMLVSPPVMPVMPAPVRPVPMMTVPSVSAPVMVMSVASVRAVRPRMVSAPVMPVPVVLVPVMRGLDPRAGGPQLGHGDEKRRAGCKQSEELIP